MKDPFDVVLDPEELEIEDALNDETMISAPNAKEEIEKIKEAVRSTLQKKRNVNLRLPEQTIRNFKVISIRRNIPYQTLMASALHEYTRKELES
jgi:predicted DNA binding CopG/RHH family protein